MSKNKCFPALAMFLFFSLFLSCGENEDFPNNNNCQLEPDPGPCNAAFRRYYYDKQEKKCKEFIWGGCGGVVPFETLEACKECE